MAIHWRRDNEGNRQGWRKAYAKLLQDPDTLDRLIVNLEAEYERLPHKQQGDTQSRETGP